jgi:DNA-binding transcriptional regulator YbjK
MPPRANRRVQILDAAIDILAAGGVGALTHRQIDERAGLPTGTTSNYFRSRLALLEAAAAYTAELHWRQVEAIQTLIGKPISRDGVVALLARLISNPDEQYRRRTLARFELFLEGTRRPQLRPFLAELQAAAIKSATVILEAAGFSPSPEEAGELSRLLNGLLFSNLTFSPEHVDIDDAASTIDRLISAILQSPGVERPR